MSVGMLPLVLSLIFPACGKAGAQGIRPPGIVDFNHLVLPKSPNKALAAPVGFAPHPDLTTPRYRMPPTALFAEIASVAAAEPRTYVLDSYPARFQAAWVVRTPAANFPDVVEAAVRPDGADASALILYSHSIYGYSDFGVNQARLKSWLTAIDSKVIRTTP